MGVVVPTHDRPELLRETLRAILDQDADADLDIVVVFDRSTPDGSLESLGRDGARVRVVANERTPGLAGARNTGILVLDTEWVAFCDDDDVWERSRLRAQLARADEVPEAVLLTTAIRVVYDGDEAVRLAGRDEVRFEDLLRSRMAMLHSSTLLIRRASLTGELGLVDEAIPGSQNEDWDLLLRAARVTPIQHVDEPLVRVRWGRTSHFSRRWDTHVASLEYMLARYPGIAQDRRGSARVFGQLAFGSAALRRRRSAAGWALRALRRRWNEPRAFLALAVASGIVHPERILAVLNKRGRGV